jgi:hypothetical protein
MAGRPVLIITAAQVRLQGVPFVQQIHFAVQAVSHVELQRPNV